MVQKVRLRKKYVRLEAEGYDGFVRDHSVAYPGCSSVLRIRDVSSRIRIWIGTFLISDLKILSSRIPDPS
jgi:hypothetical protein